ncbi:MAG: LysR family transcriptional regulator [Advenella sp.]|nr:LysR family transcriptional regulator [Advenella sp.]
MNSDNLALFAAVVHAGSISRAAIEKGLDQSTVNRPCQAIEEAEKLFDHPKKSSRR